MKELNQRQKDAVRVRLQRILCHSGTPKDIVGIFSDLRFTEHLPPEVQDLADFAAHQMERDRGPLLNSTSALFKQLRKHLQGQAPLNVYPGYTDEQVAKALISFCTSSGVLQVPEPIDLSQLVPLVAVYGLVSIHGCEFARMDTSKGTPLHNPQFAREIGNWV